MPKVPLIQIALEVDPEAERATVVWALDMNGNLWRRDMAEWEIVEGPDDTGETQRAWGKHD